MYFIMCSRLRKGFQGQKTMYVTMFSRLRKRRRCQKPLYFKLCSRLRKGATCQKHCILQCVRTSGNGAGAKDHVCYNVFAPAGKTQGPKKNTFYNVFASSEKANVPNTLYFTMFSRLRKGPRTQPLCILQGFRAFGKGRNAQHIVFYIVFAPSEKAKRPKTLYFTLFSRLRTRRRGPKHRILQCFRAFGKGGAAQNIVFYNVFAPSETAKRPKHCI